MTKERGYGEKVSIPAVFIIRLWLYPRFTHMLDKTLPTSQDTMFLPSLQQITGSHEIKMHWTFFLKKKRESDWPQQQSALEIYTFFIKFCIRNQCSQQRLFDFFSEMRVIFASPQKQQPIFTWLPDLSTCMLPSFALRHLTQHPLVTNILILCYWAAVLIHN